MPEDQRVGDLEIDQDLTFQRRSWKVQRIAWVVMALLVLAALLGVFGNGPLSHATAGQSGGALWLEYQRFARFESPVEYRFHFGLDAIRSGEIILWLDGQFLRGLQVEHITPEPQSVESSAGGLIYHFKVADGAGGTEVALHARTGRFGKLRGAVRLPEQGASIGFDQWIYP